MRANDEKKMNGMIESEKADSCQKQENLFFFDNYYKECINAHFRARISQTLLLIVSRHYRDIIFIRRK